MSEGFVSKLLNPKDRLGVMRLHAILTGDLGRQGEKPGRTDYSKELLSPKTKSGFDYLHVAKADRVSYFDVRPEALPAPHLKLHIEPQSVSAQFLSHKKAKVLRPMFYLPYEQNGTARMTLSEPDGYNGEEVRFFATATIDGCSVYIEGPSHAPKVTHINAAAISPTTRVDPWDQKQLKIQAKIADMDARFVQVQRRTGHVLERPHYMVEEKRELKALKKRFAQTKGIPYQQIGMYDPFGAVLGFQDGGHWTFYVQKSAKFDWRRRPEDPPRLMQSSLWVHEVLEIWPNGPNHYRQV